MKRKYSSLIIGSVVSLLLASCHGSGGSSPAAPPAAPTATKLLISVQPTNTSAMTKISPVEVRLVDGADNLDTTATNVVTLSFGTNPAEILVHNTGNGPYILEVVDLVTGDRLGWFESQPGDEIGGMAYDPSTGLLFYTTRNSNNFLSLNTVSDSQTVVGAGTVDEFKGITFEQGGLNRLLAVPSSNTGGNVDDLYSLDKTTGDPTVIGTIIPDMGSINGFNGMATDPTDGKIYVVAQLGGLGLTGRALMTLDSSTLAATFVGDMVEAGGDNSVAGIAIATDGTLFAISGDGSADNPESLFTVDKATGALTLVADLSIPLVADGEAIGIVPARLLGTRSVAAVGGIATFNDLSIDAVANGYTLQATATGLTAATSNAFNVTGVVGQSGIVDLATAAQTVDESVGAVSVGVSIDAPQTHDVVVSLEVSGSATGGGDDHDISLNPDGSSNFFNITIPAGELTASRTFNVIDDAVAAEGTETVDFTLVNASLATIGVTTTVHTVDVTDND